MILPSNASLRLVSHTLLHALLRKGYTARAAKVETWMQHRGLRIRAPTNAPPDSKPPVQSQPSRIPESGQLARVPKLKKLKDSRMQVFAEEHVIAWDRARAMIGAALTGHLIDAPFADSNHEVPNAALAIHLISAAHARSDRVLEATVKGCLLHGQVLLAAVVLGVGAELWLSSHHVATGGLSSRHVAVDGPESVASKEGRLELKTPGKLSFLTNRVLGSLSKHKADEPQVLVLLATLLTANAFERPRSDPHNLIEHLGQFLESEPPPPPDDHDDYCWISPIGKGKTKRIVEPRLYIRRVLDGEVKRIGKRYRSDRAKLAIVRWGVGKPTGVVMTGKWDIEDILLARNARATGQSRKKTKENQSTWTTGRKLEKVLDHVSKNPQSWKLDTSGWNALFSVQAGNVEGVAKVLASWQQFGQASVPDANSLINYIVHLGTLGETSSGNLEAIAMRVISEFVTPKSSTFAQICASPRVLGSLILTLGKVSRVKSAEGLYEQSVKIGYADARVHTAMLSVYARHKLRKAAHRVYHAARSEPKVVLDERFFATAKWLHDGRFWSAAEREYLDSQKSTPVKAESRGQGMSERYTFSLSIKVGKHELRMGSRR